MPAAGSSRPAAAQMRSRLTVSGLRSGSSRHAPRQTIQARAGHIMMPFTRVAVATAPQSPPSSHRRVRKK